MRGCVSPSGFLPGGGVNGGQAGLRRERGEGGRSILVESPRPGEPPSTGRETGRGNFHPHRAAILYRGCGCAVFLQAGPGADAGHSGEAWGTDKNGGWRCGKGPSGNSAVREGCRGDWIGGRSLRESFPWSRERLAESRESLPESRERLAESRESLAESRESLAESRERLAETREGLAETRESFRETRESFPGGRERFRAELPPVGEGRVGGG